MISSGATKVLLGAIAIYRAVVSPWLPSRCRFAPSCSAYAAEAIAAHGPLAGTRLAAARIARCHPWHAGGHDPVPAVPRRGTTARGD
jgi:putative membrane protein insertion efficiency factor